MKYRQLHCLTCCSTVWEDRPDVIFCGECSADNGKDVRMSVIDDSDKLPIRATLMDVVRRVAAGESLRWVYPRDDWPYGRHLMLGMDFLDEDIGMKITGAVQDEHEIDGVNIVELTEVDGILEYQVVMPREKS